jgi:hypothetical protein
MDRRTKLFLLSLIFVLAVGAGVFKMNESKVIKNEASVTISDSAVAKARAVYLRALSLGTDMTNGPCLSNDLMPDWVVDIVHSPREVIDDLPHNQCQRYIDGFSKHIVELDLSGNVVRVR